MRSGGGIHRSLTYRMRAAARGAMGLDYLLACWKIAAAARDPDSVGLITVAGELPLVDVVTRSRS